MGWWHDGLKYLDAYFLGDGHETMGMEFHVALKQLLMLFTLESRLKEHVYILARLTRHRGWYGFGHR